MAERMSLVAWMLAIAVSVAALVVSAASRAGNPAMGYLHMAVSAGVSILFALLAIRAMKALANSGASAAAVSAETVRSLGLVWTWVAIVIAVTYGTGVLAWKEWISHFAGIFTVGAVNLAVAAALGKSTAQGTSDSTMMNIAWWLIVAQVITAIAVIVGFLIEGQVKRFLVERYTDWPAKNVMFFGSLAVAAIGGAALRSLPRPVTGRG